MQNFDGQHAHNLIFRVFLAYFLVSIFMLGWLLWPFVSTLIMAATVTGLFNPAYRFLHRKTSSSITASLTTCLLIVVVLLVPIVSLVGILSKEAYDLVQIARDADFQAPLSRLIQDNRILEQFNDFLAVFNVTITSEDFNRTIGEIARMVGLFLYDQARAITSNVLVFLVNFFLMLVVVFYLFIDQERLFAFMVNLSPLPDEQDRKLFHKFKEMAGAILIGNGLSGLIQGVLGGGLFAFFGLRSPFLWGVIMALLAFLPILGIGAVLVPAAVFLLLKGRIVAGIIFIVFYVLVSGGIEYLFKPKVVGKRVQMHTLMVFLSIIGGLNLFGILGIIYGPLIVTAFLTLTDIYQTSYRQLVDPSTL